MESAGNLNILFIINPASGVKGNIDWEAFIRNYCKPLLLTIDFYILSGKDDDPNISNCINQLSPQKVVAVGGDGTISMIAQHLQGTSIPLGILRGGSANGMATELSIPEDPEEALEMIINGHKTSCDLIQIADHASCIHLSDLGLNARLIKYFDKGSVRGMLGYSRVFLKILWQRKLMNAHIITDEQNFHTPAYMIVIANASKYGTGAIINPEGVIHDGKFELVIVRKITLREIIKMFLKNKPFDPKYVEIFKTSSATITTKKPIHFQIDGEYIGKINKVRASILPHSIIVLTKAEAAP